MIVIDSLLTAPVRGLLFILREVAKAAAEEQATEERNLRGELASLYRALETGQITEAAFDAREAPLLARLDRLRGQPDGGSAGPDAG